MIVHGDLQGSLKQLSDLAKEALIESQLAIRERDEGGQHNLTVLKDCIDTMYAIANRGDMRKPSERREKLESNALIQLQASYDELRKEHEELKAKNLDLRNAVTAALAGVR
jgi:hypothetical protein